MSYSTIATGKIAAALARQIASSSMAMGVADAHSPESIEAMATQLAARVMATSLHDASGTEVVVFAVPIRAHVAMGDQLSDRNGKAEIDDDGISPDELMGLLNAAKR